MRCGCGCGQITPVASRNRAQIGHVKGQHTPFVVGHRPGISVGFVVEDRGHETPCYVWRGTSIGGYGRTKVDGKQVMAHIAAYEQRFGPVPAGLKLDHLCRVPLCVNPDHLEPVTHAENCRRGRATKLSADQVRTVRSSSESAVALAARFGVRPGTVYAIRRGRLWKGI